MKFILPTLASTTLILAGCSNAEPSTTSAYLYVQTDTGEPCEPDMTTLGSAPLRGHNGKGNGNGGHNSPTGISGDNIDDPHSGKIDCYYDGNSGQGNDKGGCLLITRCDANGCCETPDDGSGEDPSGSDPNDPNGSDPNDPNGGDPNDPNGGDPDGGGGLDDDGDGVDDDGDGKIDEDYGDGSSGSGLDDDGDGVDDDGDGKIDEDYGNGSSGDGTSGGGLDDDGDGVDDDGDGKIDEDYVGDGDTGDTNSEEPPIIR